MDKRLSTGRLITDRLILKSIKGVAVVVAVWGGLGYACHFIAERSRAEEYAIETKIAVARRVLAETVGEPSAGGGANCQLLRSVLDEAQSTVAEVNNFSENVIAEKCSEAEERNKRILPGARKEATTLLVQLRQLKSDYASSREEFNRMSAIFVKANDAIQKRVSLTRKLNQYRTGLKSVIDKNERGSSHGDGKQLLGNLEFMDVRGMKTSDVIAKACSEVEDSWAALSDADKVVADMIDQVETTKRGIRPKVDELNAFVASAEKLHTRFMHLPAVERWVRSAEWYRTQCRSIDSNVRRYMSGPYFYDKTLADVLLDKVSGLQENIMEEDAPEPVEPYRDLLMKYNEFKKKCTWRQGVKHPEVAHVVSSNTPNQWIAESGWEFVYPGTSNLTVRRKAPTWARPKEWYERECSVIEKNVRFYTSGGYLYPRDKIVGIFRLIQNLRHCLNANDPEESARVHSDLKAAYDTFVNQCQWAAGLRHSRFPHVVSGMIANQWVAENGWEFVNPGTSDFTVREKPVSVICPQCYGSGQVFKRARCHNCGGRCKVANPAAQIGDAIGDISSVINSGRRRRRIPNMPRIPIPSTIPCPECKGKGYQQQPCLCSKCGGSGFINQNQR